MFPWYMVGYFLGSAVLLAAGWVLRGLLQHRPCFARPGVWAPGSSRVLLDRDGDVVAEHCCQDTGEGCSLQLVLSPLSAEWLAHELHHFAQTGYNTKIEQALHPGYAGRAQLLASPPPLDAECDPEDDAA